MITLLFVLAAFAAGYTVGNPTGAMTALEGAFTWTFGLVGKGLTALWALITKKKDSTT